VTAEYGWEFLWSVVAGSAGSAALLAIAAYLGRSQLSHWLSKDLEAIKASHQRELEAYKVSLIAAVERTKAEQDLKKSSALKIVEMKFAAFSALHAASVGGCADVVSTAKMNSDFKSAEEYARLRGVVQALRQASYSVRPFLGHDEIQVLTNYRSSFVKVLAHCLPDTSPMVDQQDLIDELIALESQVDTLIRSAISQMQTLG